MAARFPEDLHKQEQKDWILLNLNCNGHSVGVGTVDYRFALIKDLFFQTRPTVAFLQEITTHKAFNRTLHASLHSYEIIRNEGAQPGIIESIILFDRDLVACYKDQKETEKIKEQVFQKLREAGKITDLLELHMGRLCLCFVHPKGCKEDKILLASWHGKYRGMVNPKKAVQFEDLTIFIGEILKAENVSKCIMGADFNLDIDVAIDISKDTQFTVCDYQSDVVDYFLTKNCLLSKVSCVDFTDEIIAVFGGKRVNKILDHYAVRAIYRPCNRPGKLTKQGDAARGMDRMSDLTDRNTIYNNVLCCIRSLQKVAIATKHDICTISENSFTDKAVSAAKKILLRKFETYLTERSIRNLETKRRKTSKKTAKFANTEDLYDALKELEGKGVMPELAVKE